ncbi:NAD(P)H-dependent oxidoreductase [Roseateles sp. P5_E11]
MSARRLNDEAPRALIVYAHPEPRLSFNAALRGAAQQTLEALGYHVTVEDLYANGFQAAAGIGDFLDPTDAPRFGLVHEQRHALRTDSYAPDIVRAQALVAAADVLLLQFPYWWYGPPAILKGWFDRVLTYGFAYEDGRLFETGLLKGRYAMVSMTTGGTQEELEADGAITGSVHDNLQPVLGGVLRFVGMDVLPSHVAYAPASLEPDGRAGLIEQYRAHLNRSLANLFD